MSHTPAFRPNVVPRVPSSLRFVHTPAPVLPRISPAPPNARPASTTALGHPHREDVFSSRPATSFPNTSRRVRSEEKEELEVWEMVAEFSDDQRERSSLAYFRPARNVAIRHDGSHPPTARPVKLALPSRTRPVRDNQYDEHVFVDSAQTTPFPSTRRFTNGASMRMDLLAEPIEANADDLDDVDMEESDDDKEQDASGPRCMSEAQRDATYALAAYCDSKLRDIERQHADLDRQSMVYRAKGQSAIAKVDEDTKAISYDRRQLDRKRAELYAGNASSDTRIAMAMAENANADCEIQALGPDAYATWQELYRTSDDKPKKKPTLPHELRGIGGAVKGFIQGPLHRSRHQRKVPAGGKHGDKNREEADLFK